MNGITFQSCGGRVRTPALRRLAVVVVLAFAANGSAAPAPGVVVDANARLRLESRERNFTFNGAVSSPTDDTWLLSRLRLGIKASLAEGWAAYGQFQDAREIGSDRSGVPFVAGSEGDDPVDFRQLYLERKSTSATWRMGRQLLAFGDERLVGPLEWNNFSRSFDAARLTLPNLGGGLDVFAGSVVQVQPGGRTGWHANHSSRDDIFAGVYSRFDLRPTLKAEPYAFWRRATNDLVYTAGAAGSARPYDIPQKVATIGVRLVGGPAAKLNGFDYDADFAWQTGEARARQLVAGALAYPGPRWLDHRAWAAHAGIGYASGFAGLPWRLYLEFNRASGDRDPADGRTESFLNLFPTNHKFYGGMDALAWKNLREVAVTASTTIAGVKVRLEQHWFELDSVNDTWFRANGVTAVRPLTAAARSAPRRAGAETDLVLSRTLGKRVTVEAGASYFTAGAYLRHIGGASDARFGYLQTVWQW